MSRSGRDLGHERDERRQEMDLSRGSHLPEWPVSFVTGRLGKVITFSHNMNVEDLGFNDKITITEDFKFFLVKPRYTQI